MPRELGHFPVELVQVPRELGHFPVELVLVPVSQLLGTLAQVHGTLAQVHGTLAQVHGTLAQVHGTLDQRLEPLDQVLGPLAQHPQSWGPDSPGSSVPRSKRRMARDRGGVPMRDARVAAWPLLGQLVARALASPPPSAAAGAAGVAHASGARPQVELDTGSGDVTEIHFVPGARQMLQRRILLCCDVELSSSE